MESINTKEKFIELRAKGWSFDKIAKELGKAKQTLID
jgi:transcriptional regulator